MFYLKHGKDTCLYCCLIDRQVCIITDSAKLIGISPILRALPPDPSMPFHVCMPCAPLPPYKHCYGKHHTCTTPTLHHTTHPYYTTPHLHHTTPSPHHTTHRFCSTTCSLGNCTVFPLFIIAHMDGEQCTPAAVNSYCTDVFSNSTVILAFIKTEGKVTIGAQSHGTTVDSTQERLVSKKVCLYPPPLHLHTAPPSPFAPSTLALLLTPLPSPSTLTLLTPPPSPFSPFHPHPSHPSTLALLTPPPSLLSCQ